MTRILPLFLLLLGCPPDPPDDTDTKTEPTPEAGDVVILTNTAHGCVRFLDYNGARLRAEICFDDLLPDQCGGTMDNGWGICQAFSVIYDRETDPESLIMVFARQAEDDDDIRPGGVVALDLSWPLEPTWRVQEVSLPPGHALHETCLSVHEELGDDPAPPVHSEQANCYSIFPHEIGWMPGRELLALSDTTLNRVMWFAPPEDGSTVAEAVAVLEPENRPESEDDRTLNCLEVVEHGDQTFLLNSYKTSVAPEAAGEDIGRLMLWDVTDLDDIQHVWSYPEDGWLAAVHGPSMWETNVGLLLTYAHSGGASTATMDELGTVGVALAHWDHPPVYLGDLMPMEGELAEPMGFVRDVKLVHGGLNRMLVLDSGCETPFPNGCDREARLLEMDVVLPEIPGLGGVFSDMHEDQTFVRTPVVRTLMKNDLLFPFETQHIPLEDVGPGLRSFLNEGRDWLDDDGPPPEDSGVTE